MLKEAWVSLVSVSLEDMRLGPEFSKIRFYVQTVEELDHQFWNLYESLVDRLAGPNSTKQERSDLTDYIITHTADVWGVWGDAQVVFEDQPLENQALMNLASSLAYGEIDFKDLKELSEKARKIFSRHRVPNPDISSPETLHALIRKAILAYKVYVENMENDVKVFAEKARTLSPPPSTYYR